MRTPRHPADILPDQLKRKFEPDPAKGHKHTGKPGEGPRLLLRDITGGGGVESPTHDPVTIGPGSDAALVLTGQSLVLADVLTSSEHTAIGNSAPHHAQAHLHTGADGTAKLAQANTHESADTDAATTSLHHTIGITATKAAAGDHTHASSSAYRRVQLACFVSGTLAVGATQVNFRTTAPETMTILKVRLLCGTAPTGAAIIGDIHKNGTTIFTTQANRPQIAAGATSGVSVAPDVTALTETDLLTFDIDQVGSTIAGANLTFEVICVAQAGGSVWFNGAGVPGAGTGNDGDYYLRTSTGDVYQKVAGAWGAPIENLTGPTGPAGASTFDALTDTPANKTGSALKVVRVNAGEGALEYGAVEHAAVTVADSTTIDLTLAGQQISGAAISQMSITADASGLKLSGDATSPGNNKVYGTDGAGTKGWKADPAGGGGGAPSVFDTTGKLFAGLAYGGTVSGVGCTPGVVGTKVANNDATTTWTKLTSAATTGSAIAVSAGDTKVARRAHNPTFIAHLKTDATVAAMRIWVGLFNGSVTNVDDPAGTSLAVFRYSAGVSANWYCCCKDATTMNAVDSGIACAINTAYWLKIVVNDGAGTVAFYIDGVLVQTLNANLPAAATELGIMAPTAYTDENVAKAVSVAGFQCTLAA